MIKATVIADSLNEFGNRITTFVITFPRIVLAEFNTHRMFSRNSASSRAIPFAKMVEAVQENPFIPLKWMKDHKGMQGTEYFEDGDPRAKSCHLQWLVARDNAAYQAEILNQGIGLTKQIANRLLEPWMWHTAIVTATEFENFYALRAEGGAEVHIAKLAEEMLVAQNASNPRQLKAGEWHIPYGDQMNNSELMSLYSSVNGENFDRSIRWNDTEHFDQSKVIYLKLKIATARCAQVSYTLIGEDGMPMDYAKLIALHDRLAKAGHWSPFEHCAKAMTSYEQSAYAHTVANDYSHKTEYGWCGNFRGFIQYRKAFENENRTDSRLIRKVSV